MIRGNHAYRYAVPSSLNADGLLLGTAGGRALSGPMAAPRFFTGFAVRPAVLSRSLLAVADVAAARYVDRSFEPYPKDPVVTSDGEQLRFESVSLCAGVYARLDVSAGGIDGDLVDRGTTNVDVGAGLRRLLTTVADSDTLHLAVGADELVMSTIDDAVTERKVPLPSRWLRAFAEAQQLASRFDLRFELDAARTTRVLRDLARPGQGGWLVPAAGTGARRTGSGTPGAVWISGGVRLSALVPLLRYATGSRWYGPIASADAGPLASACELILPGMRLTLLMSPDMNRGISGEGASLSALIGGDALADADRVGGLLDFGPRIDIADLAADAGLSVPRARDAVAVLAVSGRVGYDLGVAAHFHRELPYLPESVEALNPRLRSAHELAALTGAIEQVGPDLWRVLSTSGSLYNVRRSASGLLSCTCQWWNEYAGSRGPCRHVLAVSMSLETDR